MLCSKSSIAIILATASCVMAFQPAMSKIWSRASSLRDTTPVTETETQTVQDLNLEEMFEVFDKADKTVSSSEIPKGLAGSKFEASKQFGSSAPFGFFDPSGYTIDITEEQFKLYQEAEIKHGRVSMLAFLGMVVGELFNPLFNGEITGPAIYQFQQADAIFPLFWVGVLWSIAMIEGQTIITAWQPLEETLKEPMGFAKLQKDHQPGNLGFDPLKLMPKNKDAATSIRTKELNNGRLAMIGVAGVVAQELVTGSPIF